MSRITKKTIDRLKANVADTKLTLAERKAAYRALVDGMLNPKNAAQFDPATFDPMDGVDHYEIKKRPRKDPQRRLPTMGMRPKELMEGQMVGMYESKQDLYLLIAWLSERVSDLEDKLQEHGIY